MYIRRQGSCSRGQLLSWNGRVSWRMWRGTERDIWLKDFSASGLKQKLITPWQTPLSRTDDFSIPLTPLPICGFTSSFKPLDHAKSVWLRTLGCHSLGFGFCNSIRAMPLKADAFHSPYLSSWRCLCQPTDAGFYISKLLTCQSRSFTPLMLFASEDCTSVPWSSY